MNEKIGGNFTYFYFLCFIFVFGFGFGYYYIFCVDEVPLYDAAGNERLVHFFPAVVPGGPLKSRF